MGKRFFSAAFRLALGITQAPLHGYWGMKFIILIHLVLSLKMFGAIPSSPPYKSLNTRSSTYMVWWFLIVFQISASEDRDITCKWSMTTAL
jgi:hypothetical protein